MDRSEALERLPETYVSALALRDRGFDEAGIAATLSLDPAAVSALLRVAEQKLALLIHEGGRASRTRSTEVER